MRPRGRGAGDGSPRRVPCPFSCDDKTRVLTTFSCFTVGVYSTGPIWGRIVDSRGPRILLACAFLFLLCGYSCMRYLYDAGLPEGKLSISTLELCFLFMFSFLTGSGGNGGL